MSTTPGATAPTRKTKPIDFFSVNPEQMLFSVRAGIPADDALQAASCVLSTAQDVIAHIAETDENGGGAIWGAFYLLQMAHAAVSAASTAVQKETEATP